jgi:hypothetical protein
MSKSLADLLADKNYQEPPEVRQIKEFVEAEIGLKPGVDINTDSYIIKVPSAAAAGALRSNLFKLKEQLDTEKRLLIRIG